MPTVADMQTEIEDLKHEIKRHRLLTSWLETMVGYFRRESKPRPSYDYVRGQVILVDFGFNVGTEFGGIHYAVVLVDSPRWSPKVVVLPLTSQKPKKKYTYHIEIDPIPGLGRDHWASSYEVRSVDKLRTQPKTQRVSGDTLNRISDTIVKTVALR